MIILAAHDTADLVKLLDHEQTPLLYSLPSSKRVVLVFGGQSKHYIGLSHRFYSCQPIFRKYIDICDDSLKRLGYPSLFPSIFQSTPVSEIVVLQVGLFAMQYACAQSWIASGIQVDAVLGHSIGELTTLTVSGVLSLYDGIKLCAGRAQLIQEKWGTELGAMMVIHASREVTQQAIDCFHHSKEAQMHPSSIDIACYNGPESHVLVGNSQTIASVDVWIRTDPRFQAVKFKRLGTSHGFHSVFTEPILESLDEISASLTWNAPKIPLESCTQEKLESFTHNRASSHARHAVYFEDAVRRIERTFGACAWLEGGVDTGIISLVKHAVKSPEQSSFHTMNTKGSLAVEEAVSQVVISLWHQGVICGDWNSSQWRPVWLPPYQFQGPNLWLPNIDRSAHTQEKFPEAVNPDPYIWRAPVRPGLVVPMNSSAGEPESREFSINTSSERFRKALIGHAVCGRPLCPAGMYMECAAMALQSFTPHLDAGCLQYENMKFTVALGIDRTRHVNLRLYKHAANQSWGFSVRSSPINELTSKFTEHASGTISLLASIDLSVFQRLISGGMRLLRDNSNVEKLRSGRAYKLFSRVVDYGGNFRGISNIAMDDREALADIRIPEDQPHRDESTVFHLCDAMVIDSFVQTVGLLINSSDSVGSNDVLIATSFDSVSSTRSARFDDSATWKVYAKYDITIESHVTGDVFVLTNEGLLVMTIIGCHFMKLPIATLTKVLDSANPDHSPRESSALPLSRLDSNPSSESSKSFCEGSLASVNALAGSTSISATPSTESEKLHELALREIISEYTGVSTSKISGDAVVADLGVDSLTAVEMTEELTTRFGKAVSTEDLATITFSSLSKLLIPGSSSNPDRGYSKPDREIPVDAKPSSNCHLTPDAKRYQVLCDILGEYCGASQSAIEQQKTVEELGIDSLSMVEMKGQIEETFDVKIMDDQMTVDSTAVDVMKLLGIDPLSSRGPSNERDITCHTPTYASRIEHGLSSHQAEPFSSSFKSPSEALEQAESRFHQIAAKHGFVDYWSIVAPTQNKLSASYILEAYETLDTNNTNNYPGQSIGPLPCLPKYSRLAQRLLDILEKENLIHRRGQEFFRSDHSFNEPSCVLLERLITQWPQYEIEARMMALTGPRLAECLSGRADPMSLFFGNMTSSKIMDDWYSKAPLLATMTDQLLGVIHDMLPNVKPNNSPELKILEVGAGSGGTTQSLAEALLATGLPVKYTFTDISSRLVQKAKKKFRNYDFMTFEVFNVCDGLPKLQGPFDLVISTNCVHATSSRIRSLRSIRELLNADGIVILSEGVCMTPWCDVTFGLLDGWWSGPDYPLQAPEVWMSDFKAAGYSTYTHSQGPDPESNTQCLLLGTMSEKNALYRPKLSPTSFKISRRVHTLKTIVFKRVDGLELAADIYMPTEPPAATMPIGKVFDELLYTLLVI